ncbi:MAG: hypothetical protein AB7F85_09900 [Hyphomonadaceae bacterium]
MKELACANGAAAVDGSEQMNNIRMVAAAILALMMVSVAVLMFDDYTRRGLLGSGGLITSGATFGLEIGMTTEEASRLLATKGLARDQDSGDSCFGRDYPSQGEMLELWDDTTWRRGVICLGVRENRVVSIAWSYGGWQL